MAITYDYDGSRIPVDFDEAAFDEAVKNELVNLGAPADANDLAQVAVRGLLLLDDQTDPNDYGFGQAVQKAYFEFLGKVRQYNYKEGDALTPIRQVYQAIADSLGAGGAARTIFYQEIAAVARYVIAHNDDVPYGHPNYNTQIRLGDDTYVSAQAPLGTIEIPPLSGATGASQEIQKNNVLAVGKWFMFYQLEQTKIFAVVDRLVELFTNGLLALGNDKGGDLLNEQYNFSIVRPEFMNQAHRYMHYSRLFGVRGGEISSEVQPNTEFDRLWMRALSSLAEYDRQQRIDDLFRGVARERALNQTGENVRSAIRDLANNISLYGWGYTFYAARNLGEQLTRAFNLLNSPFIQKTCGATTAWQVIEYYARDFGPVPNIVKYRTIAEQGNIIFTFIANKAPIWSGASALPLFPETTVLTGARAKKVSKNSDFSEPEMRELMRATQLILAVSGIKDQDVTSNSEPAESISAPSMPVMGDTSRNSGIDQIRQIVSQGRAPTMEELQKLIPSNDGMKIGV